MQAVKDIKRPALRYYGGKWRLAPWIISYFPEHKNYVEPCGGAGSVLLQKPRSLLETYNDLDRNVVNFFRILRDQHDALIRKISLTPWSRIEYEKSLEPCTDDIERARRFFFFCWAAIVPAIKHDSPGFRVQKFDKGKHNTPCHDAFVWPELLEKISERFIGVQIENLDYSEIIEKYDSGETLFYFDPPYVASTRDIKDLRSRLCYAYEWTEEQHIKCANLLQTIKGCAIVSGYQNSLYSYLYEKQGWKRKDKEAQTNNGGKRVESLWLSPKTMEALGGDNKKMVRTSNQPRQLSWC